MATHSLDQLETMLIMALDLKLDDKSINATGRDARGSKIDTGDLLQFDNMTPNVAYTFDLCDEEDANDEYAREYSSSPSLLLNHPTDIIGRQNEIIMFDTEHGMLQWIGARKLPRRPKGIATTGKADMFYELHYREISLNGCEIYNKRIIALRKNGRPVTAFIKNSPISMTEDIYSFFIMCSMIEDTHRSNAMTATLKEHTSVKFSVPLNDYQRIFSDRDGPFKSGKKRAILHWVAKHLRQSVKGKTHTVKQHTKGISNFKLDGLEINIAPN